MPPPNGPTILGKRSVPPAPGKMAHLVSTRPILASLAAVLISEASPSSNPPPKAVPSIAAITGAGIVSTLLIKLRSEWINCSI
ncbi:hypothetical protein G9C98_003264 [Cotesia typhae]|uniref:Uncharacterized protein n=1 Tax=Cotesia typhae TaxID=2053667 RepID=A0A8J5US64_9HYME|nr:hypothetical protein G9C98_003264 [Cotesia typhae]